MTGWLIFGGIVLFIAVLLSLSITAVVEYDKDFKVRIRYLFITVFRVPQKPKKNKKKERKKEEKEAAGGLEKAVNAVEKTQEAAEKLTPDSSAPPDGNASEQAASSENAPDSSTSGQAASTENAPDSGDSGQALKRAASNAANAEKAAEEALENPDEPLSKSEIKRREKALKKAEKMRKKAESKAKLNDLKEKLPAIKLAIESASTPLKKLIRKIRVYDVTVYMLCTGDDASEAALNYGKANAVINGVCGWLSGVMTLKVSKIDINVDFQKNEPVTEVYFKVKLRVFTALACCLSFFLNIVKKTFQQKKEELNGGHKNGRTSDSRTDEHRNAENPRAC